MREGRVIDLGIPVVFPTPPPLVEAPPDPLDVLAQLVRDIYILCFREYRRDPDYGENEMPHWDGGEDDFGRQSKGQVWKRIAVRLLKLGADPLTYIRAQFRAATRRPPAPNQLLSSESVARWQNYQGESKTEVKRRYYLDEAAMQAGILPMTAGLKWSYERAVRYAISSVATVKASALYRYCLACRENLADLADYFHEQALLQYVLQKDDYDEEWGSFIPAQLRSEAKDLHTRLVGG